MTSQFHRDLKFSHEQEGEPWWDDVYCKAFGDDMINHYSVREDGWWQNAGVDRVICLRNSTQVRIDEKVRREHWDDILIELWSNKQYKTPGWGHPGKFLFCDYIAYALKPSSTCYLLPYLDLRRTLRRHGKRWIGLAKSKTGGFRLVHAPNAAGYTTESIAVPTHVLLDELTNCLTITWSSQKQTSLENGNGSIGQQ